MLEIPHYTTSTFPKDRDGPSDEFREAVSQRIISNNYNLDTREESFKIFLEYASPLIEKMKEDDSEFDGSELFHHADVFRNNLKLFQDAEEH